MHHLFGRFINFRVNERLDRALKSVKYILLVFLIVAGWVLGMKAFANANPWDAFGMLATVGQAPNFGLVLGTLLPAFVLLVLIGIGSIFVERFFCRYLCPLGAAFSLFSRLRIIKIRKPNDKCGKCRICTNQCAMGIPLYRMNTVATGECIGCMKCVHACPRRNVNVAIAGSDIQPLAAGLLATAAIAGTYWIGSVSPATSSAGDAVLQNVQSTAQVATVTDEPMVSATSQPTVKPTQPAQAARLYKDGTFEGSGMGYRGTTTVRVTIKGDVITAVKSVSSADDRRFFQAAYSTIVNEVLQAQSPQVDTVSGATYSSNGIISAVEDALSQAKA
jgi:polyferredoxin